MELIVDMLWRCIAMMKDAHESLWYEGFMEASVEFEAVAADLCVGVSA